MKSISKAIDLERLKRRVLEINKESSGIQNFGICSSRKTKEDHENALIIYIKSAREKLIPRLSEEELFIQITKMVESFNSLLPNGKAGKKNAVSLRVFAEAVVTATRDLPPVIFEDNLLRDKILLDNKFFPTVNDVKEKAQQIVKEKFNTLSELKTFLDLPIGEMSKIDKIRFNLETGKRIRKGLNNYGK